MQFKSIDWPIMGPLFLLTHLMPLVSPYTPWKHQRTCFSDIFRGYIKRPVIWNRLNKLNMLAKAKPTLTGSYMRWTLDVDGLTDFMPMVSFYTPWKHQKTSGFLMFSGAIERDQWHKMGLGPFITLFWSTAKKFRPCFSHLHDYFIRVWWRTGKPDLPLQKYSARKDCFLKPNWFSKRNNQCDISKKFI